MERSNFYLLNMLILLFSVFLFNICRSYRIVSNTSRADQRSVCDTFDATFTEAFHSVGFIFCIVAREKMPLGVSFARKDVCAKPIKHITVMANNKGTSCKIEQAFFETSQHFNIKIIRRFVKDDLMYPFLHQSYCHEI